MHPSGKKIAFSRRLPMLALTAILALGSIGPAFANSADFVRSLWPQAQAQGVSRAAYEAAFAGYNYSPKIMELTRKQPEFSQTVQQYVDRRVTDAQAGKGRAMRAEWNQTLTGAAAAMACSRKSCWPSGAWKPISAASWAGRTRSTRSPLWSKAVIAPISSAVSC
ncbi:lytic murein transglycosylase [Devosia sp. A8/3-2]|nr:lytic murein transglycosylase [Devosia sp. A8/3-2]